MSCLPSMPKRVRRIWTTPRATSCAAKKLPHCSRRSRPQLPRHVLRHCPPAPWPKPRTTHWRFGRNSPASWNTRNLSSATTWPKTPCARWRSAAKTGSTSAASKPDPKSPPSSLSSKPADGVTSPCANIWPPSSPVSPKLLSIACPNSLRSPGLQKTANLHPHCQLWVCSDAYIRRRACAGAARVGRGGRMIGLPSLQAMDRAQGARIWMASEATDMRCGFDRLAERVRAIIGENPQSGHLFVFRSRRGDRLKILFWERDGYALWYKRLEVGVFKLPRVEHGARSVELRASELAMILDGIDVSKLKRVPRYECAMRSSE